MFLEIKFTEKLLLLFQNLLAWKQIRVLWNLNYQYGIVVAKLILVSEEKNEIKEIGFPLFHIKYTSKARKWK